jgi:hypothetical protein
LKLRRKLGDVYWKLQQPAMAGRYWYLEEHKTPEMEKACRAFEKQCVNRAFTMLESLKFKRDPEEIFDTYAGSVLLDLEERAKRECGHFVKYDRSGAKHCIATRKQQSSEFGCLVTVFVMVLVVATLTVIGLRSVLGWIFG